jgi:ribose transport system permease protein
MTAKKKDILKYLGKFKLFFILILVVAVLGIINPKFVALSNFSNIFKQIATNAILAAGMTFVVLTGGIDISVGAILAFVGAISVSLVSSGVSFPVVLAVALATGALVGFINGIFVARFNLQPMIVTLATQSIFRGLTYIFTKGSPISLDMSIAGGQAYKWIGSGSILGGIPFPLVIVLIVYAISVYILNRTAYGRHVYALGGNEEAAHLSGINTRVQRRLHTLRAASWPQSRA